MFLPLYFSCRQPLRYFPHVISVVGCQVLAAGSLCSKSTHHHGHFLLAGNFVSRDMSWLRNPSQAINSQRVNFILLRITILSTRKMSHCFKCHGFFFTSSFNIFIVYFGVLCLSVFSVLNILPIIILFVLVLCLVPSV